MLTETKKKFSPESIIGLLNYHYTDLMKEFYEMQGEYFRTRYKIHNSIETSNITICLIKNVHLSILRQRERNLDYDISLNNFLFNLKNIELPTEKIVSVVKTTGIPKETVRRKLKHLIEKEIIFLKKDKEYYWNLTPKRQDLFIKVMENDIKIITKFIYAITKILNLNLTEKIIKEEIKLQFSFYFYHFLNCQLSWLKMWQTKIKDIDLIFIAIQALIPTLKYSNKNLKNLKLNNIHTTIGEANKKYKFSNNSISASSISEVSGIPRATCIRKLEKLVKLGLLVREVKTRRFYISQLTTDRTQHIIKKENIIFTIESFSDFLSIVISALTRNRQ